MNLPDTLIYFIYDVIEAYIVVWYVTYTYNIHCNRVIKISLSAGNTTRMWMLSILFQVRYIQQGKTPMDCTFPLTIESKISFVKHWSLVNSN